MKKYVLILIGVVVFFFVGVGVINYIVDPYERFGNNRLGVYIMHCERESKATRMAAHGDEYDLILLGDSRCATVDVDGIDAINPFNAAVGGGRPYEFYRFIEDYVDSGTRLVLGFSLGQDAKFCENHVSFKDQNLVEVFQKYLWNSKSIEYSARTIAKYFVGEPKRLKKNGSLDAEKWRTRYDVKNDVSRENAIDAVVCSIKAMPAFNEADMEYYFAIKNILDKKRIEYYVYLHPIHQAILDRVKGTQGYAAWQLWRERMFEIFPEMVDLSESKYSHSDNFLYTDVIHYKPEVGSEMINKEVLKRHG